MHTPDAFDVACWGKQLMRKPARRESVQLAALCCLLAASIPAPAQDASLDALVRAYPEFLVSHDGKVLVWKDGTRMPVSDGRSDEGFEEKLSHPSILDQLSIRYLLGRFFCDSPQHTTEADALHSVISRCEVSGCIAAITAGKSLSRSTMTVFS